MDQRKYKIFIHECTPLTKCNSFIFLSTLNTNDSLVMNEGIFSEKDRRKLSIMKKGGMFIKFFLNLFERVLSWLRFLKVCFIRSNCEIILIYNYQHFFLFIKDRNMKTFLTIILLLMSFVVFSQEGKFKIGDKIIMTPITGSVSVNCHNHEGSDQIIFNCRAWDVMESRRSYFLGPQDIDADKVKFIATWENGKTVKKKMSYNNKLKRTKRRVNLMTSTLLQRPLLGVGINQVAYTMFKKKEKVFEGELTFTVEQESVERRCRFKAIYTSDLNMCRNYNLACSDYFYLENNCQY